MNKNTISKATSPNPEPTSGWMLQVIAQMTKKDHATCTQVVDYLLLRLSVNNPHVKKKTLKVIKHCCESGDLNFAQTIAKKSEDVRQYATFRGQKDPLHGDALNQQVREAAQQTIDAIFRSVEGQYNGGMDYQLGSGGGIGNMQSSSSSSHLNNNNNSSGGWGSYFGRNNEPEKPTQHTGFGSGVGSNMLAASSSSGYNNPESFSNQPSPYGGGGVGSHSMQGVGSSGGMSNQPQNQSKSWKEWGMEKLNILNASNNKKMYSDHISQNFPSFMNQERRDYVPPTSNQFANNEMHGYNDHNDDEQEVNASAQWNDDSTKLDTDNTGSYEARLVDDICKPSVKKPSRGELSKFVKISEGVRSDVIASLLNDKLQEPKWKIKLNALYVIEALIHAGNGEVAGYFANHTEHIEKAGEAVQTSVAKRASEILNVLHPNSSMETMSQQSNSTTSSSAAPSLLDFVDDQPQPQASSEVEDMTDMFGGMRLKSKSKKRSTPQKKGNSSLFNMIDTVSEEDRESARVTRQRSNSKTNILATLEHFMTPTSTNSPQQPQVPTTAQPTFTTTTHTVPFFNNNNNQPQQSTSQQVVYVPVPANNYPYYNSPQQQQQQQQQQPQPQQQPQSGSSSPQMGKPNYAFKKKQHRTQREPTAFDFVNETLHKEIHNDGTMTTTTTSTTSSNNNGSAFDFL